MTRATADTEIVAKAIRLACRAPSLHNSQPWRWIVGEAVVDLFARPRTSPTLGRQFRPRGADQLRRGPRSFPDRDGRRGMESQRRRLSQPE